MADIGVKLGAVNQSTVKIPELRDFSMGTRRIPALDFAGICSL
jgi:hypothetical protein